MQDEASDTRDRCTILFGTQTGTAERFAKSLRAQLDSRYGGGTAFEVLDIEQYDGPAQLPKEKLVFLLMATYGDGDPTDSATDFWSWLAAAADAGDDLLQVPCCTAAECACHVETWSDPRHRPPALSQAV
jgi:NADPH-ferrihemoprotein reductase